MEFADYIPSVVMTVIFLAILPFGSSAWMKADAVFTSIFSLACIFAPEFLLKFQVDGFLDDIHTHMYRMFGLMLLCTTLFAISTMNSKDQAIKTTILWARVIAISIYIMDRGLTVSNTFKGAKWNSRAVYFGIYGDCLWLLGNLIFALKSTDFGSSTESYSRLDTHLRVDFLETFLFALTFYVFPGQMLGFQAGRRLGKLHMSITRMMASILFGSSMIAMSSTRFSQTEDKLKHLVCRLVVNAFLVSAQIYTQLTSEHWTVWHIYVGMMGISFWSVNAAMAYLNALKQAEKGNKKD